MMMAKCMCSGHKVMAALVWIGAINWGLIGFFDWNLVNALVGSSPTAERVVYALVGLSALLMLGKGMCKPCMKECGTCNVKKA